VAESPLVATDRFRSVMTQVASAVSVVTCALGGQPHGATISAFASLSMEPPMMLVVLNRDSGLLHIILQARRFRINVLSADQQEIATWFASTGSPDRFIGLRWKDDDGLPLLFDAQAWITCSLGEVLQRRRPRHPARLRQGRSRSTATTSCPLRPNLWHLFTLGPWTGMRQHRAAATTPPRCRGSRWFPYSRWR
jgi:flavin reductase (DIM6/NTAB) family NADH-FMN oxidoreductase RutF